MDPLAIERPGVARIDWLGPPAHHYRAFGLKTEFGSRNRGVAAQSDHQRPKWRSTPHGSCF